VYGQTWQSSLADRLGISRQQVHKWATGDAPVPIYACTRLFRDYFLHMKTVWDFASSLGIKLPRRPSPPDDLDV
jgi:hypothetical protein